MKRKRYTDEQIAFALRQAESGTAVAEICRKLGVSEPTFYRWKKKFGGMGTAASGASPRCPSCLAIDASRRFRGRGSAVPKIPRGRSFCVRGVAVVSQRTPKAGAVSTMTGLVPAPEPTTRRSLVIRSDSIRRPAVTPLRRHAHRCIRRAEAAIAAGALRDLEEDAIAELARIGVAEHATGRVAVIEQVSAA